MLAFAACGGAETVTTTETVTRTETVAAAGLPTAVEEKRAAIQAAAQAKDYEALRSLIGDQFRYTFGEPGPGGAIAYWQELERTTDETPFETLGVILGLPYTLSAGYYVWPFAYDKTRDELTDYELELLGSQEDAFLPDGGYLGWRAGITPAGEWVFYVAGD